MAELKLYSGEVAICDDGDYPSLSQYRWFLHDKGYVYRHGLKPEGLRGRMVYLHRQILGLTKGEECDHRNGDKLDNRRLNLRKATRSEQLINSRPSRANNSCNWRGVGFLKGGRYINRWRASLVKEGKRYIGGYYASPRMAALAYNDLALRHFGPQFRYFNQVFAAGNEE